MRRDDGKASARDGVCVGLGVVFLAGIIAWQTRLIPSEAVYARVGPDIVPWMVAIMLAVLGVAIVIEALRGHWHVEEGRGEADQAALGWVAFGLFLNVTTIAYIGFIVASTLLFLCTARAFGSRRFMRDGTVGFLIALIAYVGFDRGLGYEIGDGLIESLL